MQTGVVYNTTGFLYAYNTINDSAYSFCQQFTSKQLPVILSKS